MTINPPGRATGEPESTQAHPRIAVDHTPGEPNTENTDAQPTDTADSAAFARPGSGVHPVRRWPLLLIALPAFVAIWGGWVGLGRMAGFGPVEPLPGIATFTIDLAITLPIGVEVYSAYALSVWLGGQVHGQAALRFAPGRRCRPSWSAPPVRSLSI
ncbi:hypothetical protein ACFQV2_39890 [Actinokineospora soli]|uniref:Uncharacterized protein n=1 Tax=Actinokineospora soli TaxID=1048753 RepID=A0ABW2TZT6_9PSEU